MESSGGWPSLAAIINSGKQQPGILRFIPRQDGDDKLAGYGGWDVGAWNF